MALLEQHSAVCVNSHAWLVRIKINVYPAPKDISIQVWIIYAQVHARLDLFSISPLMTACLVLVIVSTATINCFAMFVKQILIWMSYHLHRTSASPNALTLTTPTPSHVWNAFSLAFYAPLVLTVLVVRPEFFTKRDAFRPVLNQLS